MNAIRTSALLALLSCFSVSTLAWAQSTTTATETSTASDSAQVQFERGKSLMKNGDYAAACEAFQKSERPEPTMSTQYHLGRCHQKLGHTATAKQHFLNAERLAKKRGDERRATAAHQRAVELVAKVPKLRIIVTGKQQKTDGLKVSMNGQPVPPANWNTPIESNPGAHTIIVSADDGRSHTIKLQLEANAKTVEAAFPGFTTNDQPAVDPGSATEAGERVRRNPALWWTGIGLTAGGGVALIAGTAIAATECTYCDVPGEATASFVAGLAMAGTGIPLMIIFGKKIPKEPASPEADARIEPMIGPTSASLKLRF